MKFKKIEFFPETDEEWMIPKEAIIANAILSSFTFNERLVIEVGVLGGAWSLNILRNVKNSKIIGIDPYPNLENLKNRALRRLENYNFQLIDNWSSLKINQKVSLIHVDGLHTEQAVYNDLIKASEHLNDNGIIIVDDYLQPIFPGVAAGWLKFIFNSDYVPFLCTGSKTYLTKKKNHSFWINSIENAFSKQVVIPWCRYLGEGKDVAYISNQTINGSRVILSFERADPIDGDNLLDFWPKQPNLPEIQMND